MPTYLINGLSGTGKTSIGAELAGRGYRVFDTDKEFGYYANKVTEEPVDFPETGHPDADWYKANGWLWKREKAKKVLNAAGNEVILFCGGSLNENTFYPNFSKIFRLIVDPETMVRRIKSRGRDPHTNNPLFIQSMVDSLQVSEAVARSLGWTVIDTSSRTTAESVDEIIAHIKGS